MSYTQRMRKGSSSGTPVPNYALLPDDLSLTPSLPDDSTSLEVSPSTTLNESFSPYFSGGAAGNEHEEFSRRSNPILRRLLGGGGASTVENETPGPGYASFSQHVMDVDGASTPVNYAPSPSTSPSVRDIGAMRKLQFESVSESQAQHSPRSPRNPHALSRNRKRIILSVDKSDSGVDLTIKPGESGMLAKSIFQEVPTVYRSETPQLQYNPSSPSIYASQPSTQGLPPTGQTQKKKGALKLHDFIIPTIYPATEELILHPPHGDSKGTKQIKLRDNFTTEEFVDFLINKDTISWDILEDSRTQRLRAVFHQDFW